MWSQETNDDSTAKRHSFLQCTKWLQVGTLERWSDLGSASSLSKLVTFPL